MNPRAFKRAHDLLSAAAPPVPATLYRVDQDVPTKDHIMQNTAWCALMPPRQGEGSDTHDRFSIFVRCGAGNLEIARRAAEAALNALRGTTRKPTGYTLTQSVVESSQGPDPVYEFYLTFRSHLRQHQA